jgi:mandelamide amidase
MGCSPISTWSARSRLQVGALTSEGLAASTLEAAERSVGLNAFSSLSPSLLDDARAVDRARRAGRGQGVPSGVPFAFKDNIDTRGLPTTGCTPALAHHHPVKDAVVASAIFGAGGLLLGKNTMQELAFGVTCRVTATGPVRNPYALDAIPGGSSGAPPWRWQQASYRRASAPTPAGRYAFPQRYVA